MLPRLKPIWIIRVIDHGYEPSPQFFGPYWTRKGALAAKERIAAAFDQVQFGYAELVVLQLEREPKAP